MFKKVLLLDADSRRRNELTSKMSRLGHVEPYESMDELARFRPADTSMALIHSSFVSDASDSILKFMNRDGNWFPLVAYGEHPTTPEIVDAIQQGAVDFWDLPLSLDVVANRIPLLLERSEADQSRRRLTLAARQRLEDLTSREREVIEQLSDGSSNKEVARALSISPRTVEIHRANIRTKVGAKNWREALRIAIVAELG